MYYITFPVRYNTDTHPTHPHNITGNSIICIESQDENQARLQAFDHFNTAWAFMYPEEDLQIILSLNNDAQVVGTIDESGTLTFND